jgi:hypothetical protein
MKEVTAFAEALAARRVLARFKAASVAKKTEETVSEKAEEQSTEKPEDT